MRAIQVSSFGGPEVLELVNVPTPTPSGDLVLLEVIAAGVNYADTHQAADDYLSRQTLPLIPGAEAVGTDPSGQRVVALVQGGYAEGALAHPSVTFALPDSVDDVAALGLVLQGTTAWHLLRTCARIVAGESVVVHAAAGGVGSLAVQLAKQFGAGRVIATASTPDKRQLALDLGADAAIDPGPAEGDQSTTDALRDTLIEANEGNQVDIVLEMTGGRVFDGSLAALAPFGRLVTYGTASRISGSPITPRSLVATSRTVSGFWLSQAAQLSGGLQPAMDELLDLVGLGLLRVLEGGRYPLEDARRAHEDLSSRRTHGKLVLDPSLRA